MKRSPALLMLMLFAAGGGCRVASNDMASLPPSPGRWQVIETENTQRGDKQPMLLDTSSGETWIETWDPNRGYYWRPVERKQ
jgi:hypothetical protein